MRKPPPCDCPISTEIAVRGKGSRIERLPLPAEIGEALAGYLTGTRPRCSATAVFVTARAPYQALTGTCIRAITGRACDRAGLSRLGAHRLRHSLATAILRAGAPLPEVGQVLRHRSQLSTAVYAKVDHAALRTLAQPWPEGGLRGFTRVPLRTPSGLACRARRV
ncbi:tyrosine-type recombinase/integrase [Streptomyces avermitilis]|uniref:tyrosine-type recombinase/integrase n=1 Tax=Streptomyces avermitilis TaxID=33903 RepID=UPI0033A0E554